MPGEGSRGGLVVGHTRSGKAIYRDVKPDAAQYRHFAPGDHASAASIHDGAGNTATDATQRLHHRNLASAHRAYYEKLVARSRKPEVVYAHSRDYKAHSQTGPAAPVQVPVASATPPSVTQEAPAALARSATGHDVREVLRRYVRS